MRWYQKLLIKYVLSYVKEEKVQKIKEALKGYKTIFIAIGAILAVVIAWSNGAMETMEAVKAIIEAILAITIRAGIASKQ